MALIMFLKRKDLAESFTEDVEVRDIVVDVLPINALTVLSLSMSVYACVLALGLQKKAAIATLILMYGFFNL